MPRPAQILVPSMRLVDTGYTLESFSRDIPDQLEAHAHRLFKDAGWTIKPRKRNDSAKMASYFTTPNKEAVHTSLTQAWEFCGNKLYEGSADSERGRYPKEWSDVDTFWKDLMDTMAYVDTMLANQHNALTLLQRWQILDPFVAVVFIRRKITSLQQHKTRRAVNSSTFVLDGSTDMPSESKTMHKTGDLLANRMIQPTTLITDSDCSTLATESYNGHPYLQSCHDAEDGNDRDINPKLCCNESLNYNASGQTEHRIHTGDDGRQTFAQAKAVNSSVKKAKKKSKRMFDIYAIGLDGLFSQSVMQSATVFVEMVANYFAATIAHQHIIKLACLLRSFQKVVGTAIIAPVRFVGGQLVKRRFQHSLLFSNVYNVEIHTMTLASSRRSYLLRVKYLALGFVGNIVKRYS